MRRILTDINLYIVNTITLMIVVGVASIAPVFPAMARGLEVPDSRLGLVITVFTLPSVVVSPLSGLLLARLGYKAMLVPSLLLFGVAGCLCGLAPDFQTLLWLRLVQGIGVAPLAVVALTYLGERYAGRDLATAFGVFAGVQTISLAAMPLAGGALGRLGWQAPFLLPGLALPVVLAVLFVLDIPKKAPPSESVASFLRHAAGALASRTAMGVFLAVFLCFLLLFGVMLTYLPVLLHQKFGLGSAMIGILISVSALVTSGLSFFLGRMVGVASERGLLMAAFVLYGLNFFLTPMFTEVWMFFAAAVVLGLAQGFSLPCLITLINKAAPEAYRSMFNAAYGTVLRMGQAAGPCLAGAVFASAGLDGVFTYGGVAALACVPVVGFMIPKIVEPPEEPEK